MSPWGNGGAALNFLGVEDTTRETVRSAYSAADFARMRRIKSVYDPGNLFRINHNIPPATG